MTSSERRGASERLPWTVTNRYNFQVIMNQYIAEEPLPPFPSPGVRLGHLYDLGTHIEFSTPFGGFRFIGTLVII